MTTRTARRGAQVHPNGDKVSVDDVYRNDVEAELVKRGWDQKDLAREISVSPATISNLLTKKKQVFKSVKDAVDALFGWTRREARREKWRLLEHRIAQLADEDDEHVRKTILLLTKPR